MHKYAISGFPVIVTDRLTLRSFDVTDVGTYSSFVADPEVMRYVREPLARDDAWRKIATLIGHWPLRGFGPWAVEMTDTGELAGRIGLWRPEGWPGIEIGWLLGREYWGHGLATEGARATIQFAREELGLTSAISVIHPKNERSIAVAERLGGRWSRGDVINDTEVGIWEYQLRE